MIADLMAGRPSVIRSIPLSAGRRLRRVRSPLSQLGGLGDDLGNSIVKLAPGAGGGLSVASSFTPSNFQMLNAQDLDIGSMGSLLVPGTKLLVGAGKQGVFYVVNRDAMGGIADATPTAVGGQRTSVGRPRACAHRRGFRRGQTRRRNVMA